MTSVGEENGTIASPVDVGVSSLTVGGSLTNGASYNSTLTALAAPVTLVQVAGTWTLEYSNGFTSPSNGVLRCNVGGLYRISMNGLVRQALANTPHDVVLLVNGTSTGIISLNSSAQFYSSATGIGHFSTEVIAPLAAGDQLTMSIATAVAPSNPRVFRYAINATKL